MRLHMGDAGSGVYASEGLLAGAHDPSTDPTIFHGRRPPDKAGAGPLLKGIEKGDGIREKLSI